MHELAPTPVIEYPPDLPISARREEIVAAIRKSRILVVAGETGSGKTTQLPKMCLEAGVVRRGLKIGCTQPRRVAAMSVSRRVAEELKVTWGREVGCKIRFNDDTGRDTQIKFMTDGILLAEIQSDPMLSAYSTLIIDEAHERSLNIDFLLGYLQSLLAKRADLRVIITSATIDTEAFSKAFGGAPIIEVSGRLYPVEVRYAPIESFTTVDEDGNESVPDLNYVEAAARATEDALIETDSGDVLVFMPTERDIRDTRDLLEASLGPSIEVLGLFGRMPSGDQQRIFTPGPKRRVIVATNVAETSLTIPRISAVVDSGLARMSRYTPRTRTKRLPIEPISQSSANQRAGRAGRLRSGVCIRLYSEEDFQKRPRFTQPEIQRANLAEVILRMKAFHLGDVETFPFLNPPLPQAIRAGYLLLQELGAITETHDMTALGHELARLPVDPTLGRMLLQAREEGVLEEMLVIAAGMSVPDPRERPEDQKEAAATAHRAFAHPESDFLTLLNIWQAGPEVQEKSSRNALRRFCKANFLSFVRMREWRDIFRQLSESVEERVAERRRRPNGPQEAKSQPNQPSRDRTAGKPAKLSAEEQRYQAIHRSILTGLFAQVAQREERNTYKASGNRQVTVFPGSGLYERREKPKKSQNKAQTGSPNKPADQSCQPQWVMAGEIVQTSMLFARNVARIDPVWVVELGSHLCEFRYQQPYWSQKAGRVLVWERVLVHGLEVWRRQIDYGRINPEEATELFIRGALVAGEAQVNQRFFAENAKLREKIETALTRVRSNRVQDLDEAFYRFYAERISGVSSIHDLNRYIRDRIAKEPNILCATEADLLETDAVVYDQALFPDHVSLGNTVLPLAYAYEPGEEHDGVTVKVPLPLAERLSTGELEWMIPGLRQEQIAVLLRALPKAIRKQLMPLEPKVREIMEELNPAGRNLVEALADFLRAKFRIDVTANDWPTDALPPHLRPRVEVVDQQNKTVVAARDLETVRSAMESSGVRSDAWSRAAAKWEKPAITSWSFGDLPESIVVEQVGGIPLLGYPGLALRGAEVDVRLFRTREEVERSAPAAVRRLAELSLSRDLAWLWKEIRGLARKIAVGDSAPAKKPQTAQGFGDILQQTLIEKAKPGATGIFAHTEAIEAAAYQHIILEAFRLEPLFPLKEQRFKIMVEAARRELPLLVRRISDLSSQLLELRAKIVASGKSYPGMESDLKRLMPADFLAATPHAQLPHLLRYLKAIQIRAERAVVSPAKDAEKAKQLAPFAVWEKHVRPEDRESFRWLLEEFRVSVFAQELGTAQPVSTQRLNALFSK